MADNDPTQQTEHERRVAETEENRDRTERGGLVGTTEETAGDTGPTPYEREIEEERTGESRGEVEGEVREDERTPLDTGYTGGRTG